MEDYCQTRKHFSLLCNKSLCFSDRKPHFTIFFSNSRTLTHTTTKHESRTFLFKRQSWLQFCMSWYRYYRITFRHTKFDTNIPPSSAPNFKYHFLLLHFSMWPGILGKGSKHLLNTTGSTARWRFNQSLNCTMKPTDDTEEKLHSSISCWKHRTAADKSILSKQHIQRSH